MGHISLGTVKALVKSGSVMGLDLDMSSESTFCEACVKAKPTHNPVPKEHGVPCAVTVGKKVHSDVWGPSTPQSYDGKDYFVSFTDDHSCWSCIEPMNYKSEALMQYQSYKAWLKMQHSVKI